MLARNCQKLYYRIGTRHTCLTGSALIKDNGDTKNKNHLLFTVKSFKGRKTLFVRKDNVEIVFIFLVVYVFQKA